MKLSVINNDESESLPKKMKRPTCKYGLTCYRKNLMHFAIYEHPDSHPFHSIDNSDKSINFVKNSEKIPKRIAVNLDNIYLTKIFNIQSNNFNELSLSDILLKFPGKLLKSAQFNFMFDCKWLISQYPNEFRDCPLLLVHGNMFSENEISQPNVESCKADLPFSFGTHHTKMMILHYETGLRVVIHTANLIPDDWNKKTQCIWMSDIFPVMTNKQLMGDSKTEFKKDLIDYLLSYQKNVLKTWISVIQNHDFSSCQVHFIASTPGRHNGLNLNKFGHMKLRDVLEKHFPFDKYSNGNDLVAQFSSIGSLGQSKESWFLGEFKDSLMASTTNSSKDPPSDIINIHLIYPCLEDVRNSLEGYLSGSSLPYTNTVHSKQLWIRPFFRKWKANIANRTHATPHMKSYLRFSQEKLSIDWFLVTSANLSKAAWGNLEKKNSQLSIRSYEVGVLFLPGHHGVSHFTPTAESFSNDSMYIPIPYDLPPVRYMEEDEPWLVDKDYKKPDICGHTWCH